LWIALAAIALAVFAALQSQLPGTWPWLAAHPEVVSALERSLEDQRRLAREHPEEAPALRARFDETQTLLSRLRILELSRPALSARYRAFLWLLFVMLLLAAVLLYVAHRRRLESRLERLREYLERLSRGEVNLAVEEGGRDTLGRVARMIERASRTAAADRQRVEQLENLAAWQEGARRVAHEIRTPLTAALLDLARLEDRCSGHAEAGDDVGRLRHEMKTIQAYVDRLATFARLPEPVLETDDLAAFARRFAEAFREAFPPVALLVAEELPSPVPARFDADLLRQALANLCRNAADAASGEGHGTVSISWGLDGGSPFLDVADDGPGIRAELRARLFQPYVTGRARGPGLGLGLAISRKILLDQGGDLLLIENGLLIENDLLIENGPRGARFRLRLCPPPHDEQAGERAGSR
jgi:nitrogen fixation/metabolism regulation signal transduction histidine kinase